MKNMYSNSSDMITDNNQSINQEQDDKKRIKNLEDEVRHLKEQINKMSSMIAVNSRQLRRQDSRIRTVSSPPHNRSY